MGRKIYRVTTSSLDLAGTPGARGNVLKPLRLPTNPHFRMKKHHKATLSSGEMEKARGAAGSAAAASASTRNGY